MYHPIPDLQGKRLHASERKHPELPQNPATTTTCQPNFGAISSQKCLLKPFKDSWMRVMLEASCSSLPIARLQERQRPVSAPPQHLQACLLEFRVSAFLLRVYTVTALWFRIEDYLEAHTLPLFWGAYFLR